MALTAKDIEQIGRAVDARIKEADEQIRADINTAFANTGQAFETRLARVIEGERELFFEAIRQLNTAVNELAGLLTLDQYQTPNSTPPVKTPTPAPVETDAGSGTPTPIVPSVFNTGEDAFASSDLGVDRDRDMIDEES